MKKFFKNIFKILLVVLVVFIGYKLISTALEKPATSNYTGVGDERLYTHDTSLDFYKQKVESAEWTIWDALWSYEFYYVHQGDESYRELADAAVESRKAIYTDEQMSDIFLGGRYTSPSEMKGGIVVPTRDNYDLFKDSFEKMESDIAGMTVWDKVQAGLQYTSGSDSDGDGLTDKEEIEVYGSDPLKVSSSSDCYPDGYKVVHNMSLSKYYNYADDIELNIPDYVDIKVARAEDTFSEVLKWDYWKQFYVAELDGLNHIAGLSVDGYTGYLTVDLTKFLNGRKADDVTVYLISKDGAEKVDASVSDNDITFITSDNAKYTFTCEPDGVVKTFFNSVGNAFTKDKEVEEETEPPIHVLMKGWYDGPTFGKDAIKVYYTSSGDAALDDLFEYWFSNRMIYQFFADDDETKAKLDDYNANQTYIRERYSSGTHFDFIVCENEAELNKNYTLLDKLVFSNFSDVLDHDVGAYKHCGYLSVWSYHQSLRIDVTRADVEGNIHIEDFSGRKVDPSVIGATSTPEATPVSTPAPTENRKVCLIEQNDVPRFTNFNSIYSLNGNCAGFAQLICKLNNQGYADDANITYLWNSYDERGKLYLADINPQFLSFSTGELEDAFKISGDDLTSWVYYNDICSTYSEDNNEFLKFVRGLDQSYYFGGSGASITYPECKDRIFTRRSQEYVMTRLLGTYWGIYNSAYRDAYPLLAERFIKRDTYEDLAMLAYIIDSLNDGRVLTLGATYTGADGECWGHALNIIGYEVPRLTEVNGEKTANTDTLNLIVYDSNYGSTWQKIAIKIDRENGIFNYKWSEFPNLKPYGSTYSLDVTDDTLVFFTDMSYPTDCIDELFMFEE